MGATLESQPPVGPVASQALASEPVRTLIRFRTKEEITIRRGYEDGLDHTKHQLARIVGQYAWARDERWPCGLKSCRQPHQVGFVVATKDGHETHLGRDCGRNHFQVEWDDVFGVYQRDLAAQQRQERMESLLAQKGMLLARALALRDALTSRITQAQALRSFIARERLVVRALDEALRISGEIRHPEEIDAEAAERQGIPESQRRRFVTVARLDASGAFVVSGPSRGFALPERLPAENILATLKGRVLPELNGLTAESIQNLSEQQQKDRAKALEQVTASIEDAARALQDLERFLAPENVQRLGALHVHRPNDRAHRILRALQAGTWKQPEPQGASCHAADAPKR